MTPFARRSAAVAVGDLQKRALLHQRIRNWQLCPDSIDKVDRNRLYMITRHMCAMK